MGLKHLVTMGGVLLDSNLDLLADSPANDEAVELNNVTDIEILKSDEDEAMKPTDSSIPLTVELRNPVIRHDNLNQVNVLYTTVQLSRSLLRDSNANADDHDRNLALQF